MKSETSEAQIKTTGDLRRFLATALTDLQAGKLELEKAGALCRIAGRINESFFAETRVQKSMVELGHSPSALGALVIGSGAT